MYELVANLKEAIEGCLSYIQECIEIRKKPVEQYARHFWHK